LTFEWEFLINERVVFINISMYGSGSCVWFHHVSVKEGWDGLISPIFYDCSIFFNALISSLM